MMKKLLPVSVESLDEILKLRIIRSLILRSWDPEASLFRRENLSPPVVMRQNHHL
jgi:hypothetical protein